MFLLVWKLNFNLGQTLDKTAEAVIEWASDHKLEVCYMNTCQLSFILAGINSYFFSLIENNWKQATHCAHFHSEETLPVVFLTHYNQHFHSIQNKCSLFLHFLSTLQGY